MSKPSAQTCQCNGRFHISPCITWLCTAPKQFVTHHPSPIVPSFESFLCSPDQIQGVAATKWRAIPSSSTSSKEISVFASLLPCLASLATGNSKKALYFCRYSIYSIRSPATGLQLAQDWQDFFCHSYTQTHTHTFWLLRLELKLLAKQMILLAPLQPACPRQGTSWTWCLWLTEGNSGKNTLIRTISSHWASLQHHSVELSG